MRRKHSLYLVVLLLLTLTNLWPRPVHAQSSDEKFVQDLIAQMSVEDKVGQLFLVAFPGNDVGPDSEIGQLIAEYRIGGVILSPENRNFVNDKTAPLRVAELTNSLQTFAFQASQAREGGPFIPLFVAMVYEGDGYPYTTLRTGMTPIPSPMAIGASWPGGMPDQMHQPDYAELIGEIVGRELRAVGVNLLLGPSLDVLNNPRPGLKGDLGTRTFGGDPYWVGKLGQAYIRGVHEGSQGRVATVAKHFPGNGGSDRSPDEEVATVDKSLQELRRIELAPFFAVTQASDPLAVTDALMTSHIRYRGFQGNIRQLTRPISFDAQGLGALMALDEFSGWRQRGLMVSDSLGVPAVRKYYDPQLQQFPYKRIAQEAFLAGNDVLLLSHFALTDDWEDQLANVRATIEFFREKYQTDPAFQARVDEALQRILRLKHRLYKRFTLDEVWVSLALLPDEIGQGTAIIHQLARDAITLIYPGPEELADRLPSPPLSDEDILIFTDARQVSECAGCPPFALLPANALEQTILQLYGPGGTGQILPNRIHSLTFRQLKAFLQPSEQEVLSPVDRQRIERFIREAEWLIFAMLDLNPVDFPDSDAVKVFLKEQSDRLRDKKTVVLAYNAPYYLDTTEISKLTAYYGVYSKVQPFIDVSVRALFQEFTPQGASPVSIPGVSYDLATRMEPDPSQEIKITLLVPRGATSVDVGTTLRVRAGPIVDRNGRLVPDGTPVTFRAFYPADAVYQSPQEVVTINGIATATILAERPGQLEITVTSGEATNTTPLTLMVVGEQPVTATPPPPPTATGTPAPTPIPGQDMEQGPGRRSPNWADLAMSLIALGVIAGATQAIRCDNGDPPERAFRVAMSSVITGLIGYVMFGLGWLRLAVLPPLSGISPPWEAFIISVVFAFIPLTILWWREAV